MLAEKKRNTNIGVGVGFLVQIVGNVLMQTQEGALALIGVPVALFGIALFIWGCMSYCEGKGHSKWLGLLGLLSIVGLLILVLLPDRHKHTVRGPVAARGVAAQGGGEPQSFGGHFDTRKR